MTAEELMRMTVKDLRALAERHGVAGTARLRKDQVIAALLPYLHVIAKAAPSLPADPTPRGSSATAIRAAAPAPAVGPNPGLPIPESYGLDRLVLLAQDPLHIFAYWEISPLAYAKAAAEAGPGAAAVLLLHTATGVEQREVDLHGGNYYLSVAPGGTYRAELALRARSGRLITLARSNFVQTPAAGPSTRTDATWMEVDETFHELLALAGLPGPDASSLSRLNARTLDAKILDDATLAARGLSSATLSRRANAHLAEDLVGARPSSASLSSTALIQAPSTR
jgi:hypothetical protein